MNYPIFLQSMATHCISLSFSSLIGGQCTVPSIYIPGSLDYSIQVNELLIMRSVQSALCLINWQPTPQQSQQYHHLYMLFERRSCNSFSTYALHTLSAITLPQKLETIYLQITLFPKYWLILKFLVSCKRSLHRAVCHLWRALLMRVIHTACLRCIWLEMKPKRRWRKMKSLSFS